MAGSSRSWIAAALAAWLVATGAPAARATGPCPADCARQMTGCRAARCGGLTRKACRDMCRALTGCAAGGPRIRTLAIVVNECRASGGVWTGRQRLEIRRGDCAPVTVMTIAASAPAPYTESLNLCRLYGESRDGVAGQAVGAFQGVAVSSDGQTIVFQVTDDFLSLPGPSVEQLEEGLFVVRPDGTGLRRIGPQTRAKPLRVLSRPEIPPGIAVLVSPGIAVSPDGKSVVLTDPGPGADGSDALQLFRVDIATGTRLQLTEFTASSLPANPDGLDLSGVFIDSEIVGGYYTDRALGGRLFTVETDGTNFRPVEKPVAVPGSQVVPTFRLTGIASDVFSLQLAEMTDVPQPGLVREVFVRDGKNVLQLTKLDRSDTAYAVRLRDRERVLFAASADPVGRNPSTVCQLFTVDRLGGSLRQLTRFDPGATSLAGCAGGEPGRTCTAVSALIAQDRVTGAIVFDSSCDPLALRPVSQQLFAVRPDGTGFRQLTAYRGMVEEADGTVTVELPGPAAYSAPFL